MNVYEKLNSARKVFHSSQIKKSGRNNFAGYDYFELGDFIVPALRIFDSVGLAGYISFGKETAELRIVNLEKPDDVIVITSPMSEANLKGCHPVQNLGAVQTYIRRYLWVAALEIVEHDALDATTGRKGDAPIIPARPPIELDAETEKHLQEFCAELTDMVNNGQAKEAYLAVKAAGLEEDQTIALWNMMEAKIRNAIKKAKEQ